MYYNILFTTSHFFTKKSIEYHAESQYKQQSKNLIICFKRLVTRHTLSTSTVAKRGLRETLFGFQWSGHYIHEFFALYIHILGPIRGCKTLSRPALAVNHCVRWTLPVPRPQPRLKDRELAVVRGCSGRRAAKCEKLTLIAANCPIHPRGWLQILFGKTYSLMCGIIK